MQRRIMHIGLLVSLFATMAYPLTRLSGHEWIAYIFTLIVGYHVYDCLLYTSDAADDSTEV